MDLEAVAMTGSETVVDSTIRVNGGSVIRPFLSTEIVCAAIVVVIAGNVKIALSSVTVNEGSVS